jgi:hypothetical protein
MPRPSGARPTEQRSCFHYIADTFANRRCQQPRAKFGRIPPHGQDRCTKTGPPSHSPLGGRFSQKLATFEKKPLASSDSCREASSSKNARARAGWSLIHSPIARPTPCGRAGARPAYRAPPGRVLQVKHAQSLLLPVRKQHKNRCATSEPSERRVIPLSTTDRHET